MKTVITYGTFDLFHTGHRRLLERASKLGDRLIVGVTSDQYDQARGKLNVIQSCEDRIKNVRSSGLADQIIIEEEEGQKIQDIRKYGADIFVVGSDWVGTFDYLKEYCEVIYLERTKGISSTDLRQLLAPIIRVGIIGCGRIAGRFLKESRFVSGMEVTAVYGRDEKKASQFADKYEIAGAYSELSHMLSVTDAIYIATPHYTHYDFAKAALSAHKHVLCEKPLTLTSAQTDELYQLAATKNGVLMEAIKTAYAPGFCQLTDIARSGTIGTIKAIDAGFTKLVTNRALREYDATQAGGAFTELSSYPLLAITKLLGMQPQAISFVTDIDTTTGVDTFTRANFIYPGATATATVGIGVKREGDLCIAGTTGYIYVPAPWWKTEYFEVRYEDSQHNRKHFTKFEGDGLRYEIAAFLRAINGSNAFSPRLTNEESIFMASVIEKFRNGEQVHKL